MLNTANCYTFYLCNWTKYMVLIYYRQIILSCENNAKTLKMSFNCD